MQRVIHNESRLWTVVPLRGMASGKSRLASVLDAAARRQLNQLLLTRTLDAIGRWRGEVSRCVVVSSCEEALETAARLGAVAVPEMADESGLNRAAALGASYAGHNGAGAVLILPCDLPYLKPESLAALVRAADTTGHMVIAPDRAGTGTNALLVNAQGPFEFRFGERSYTRHLELAAERGWTAAICSRPELAFDLDTPADLAHWLGTAEAADACCSGDIVRI